MTARVVVHVGTPKSGTTFLQERMWHNRDRLRAEGFSCPGDSQQDMFLAAIEVRERHQNWGFDAEQLAGGWARLCREARAVDGTTIMSHELLAAATPAQISSALAELSGVEVHLVLTVRDLSRQVVSEWQERVKNGGSETFGSFADAILAQVRERRFAALFWRYQHVPSILARWGEALPADRIHVVVAPRSTGDPDELWRRFGAACGFTPHVLAADQAPTRSNQTLGVTQIKLVRHLNEALAGRIPQPWYARVVKRRVAQTILPRYPSPRPGCPPELQAELESLSERWAERIRQRDYRVYGDLAEMVPVVTDRAVADPDEVADADMADLAIHALADVLVEQMRLRKQLARRGAGSASAPGAWRRPRRLLGVVRSRTARALRGLRRVR